MMPGPPHDCNDNQDARQAAYQLCFDGDTVWHTKEKLQI